MKIEEKDSPSKNDQIEAYLSAQYEFRYNTVLHRAEYRLRGKGDYTSVDRYRINTLKRALDKEANIQTSTDNLYSIIESDFSPRINPVQDCFRSLPSPPLSKILFSRWKTFIEQHYFPTTRFRSIYSFLRMKLQFLTYETGVSPVWDFCAIGYETLVSSVWNFCAMGYETLVSPKWYW